MIRARFKTLDGLKTWPIKHPFWISGFIIGSECEIVVAYADDVKEIEKNWPDAEDIEFTYEDEYTFTTRFPKPKWFEVPA